MNPLTLSDQLWTEHVQKIRNEHANEMKSLREQLAKERELRTYLVNVLQWFADEYPLDAGNLSVKELLKRAKDAGVI